MISIHFSFITKRGKNLELLQTMGSIIVDLHKVKGCTNIDFQQDSKNQDQFFVKLDLQSKQLLKAMLNTEEYGIFEGAIVKPLSSRKLAKYNGSTLTDVTYRHECFYLQTILDNITELRIVRKLVQIFKTMLTRGSGNIRRWIDFVKRSKYKLAGLKTFTIGLSRDIEAVVISIYKWSSKGTC